MLKAWTIGVVILIAVYAAWFVSLQLGTFAQVVIVLLWVTPVVAAFVSTHLAPHNKVLLGLSMAIPAAILASVLNVAHQMLGRAVDFSGLQGGVILAAVALIENVILCGVGSLAAHFLTKFRSSHAQ